MIRYIAKRLVFAIPTLLAVSIIAFIIIQLPPGDYLTTLMADWASQGGAVEEGTVAAMAISGFHSSSASRSPN